VHIDDDQTLSADGIAARARAAASGRVIAAAIVDLILCLGGVRERSDADGSSGTGAAIRSLRAASGELGVPVIAHGWRQTPWRLPPDTAHRHARERGDSGGGGHRAAPALQGARNALPHRDPGEAHSRPRRNHATLRTFPPTEIAEMALHPARPAG